MSFFSALTCSAPFYDDSCDDMRPTWIVQDNISTSKFLVPFTSSLSAPYGEGNGTPLQYSCLKAIYLQNWGFRMRTSLEELYLPHSFKKYILYLNTQKNTVKWQLPFLFYTWTNLDTNLTNNWLHPSSIYNFILPLVNLVSVFPTGNSFLCKGYSERSHFSTFLWVIY